MTASKVKGAARSLWAKPQPAMPAGYRALSHDEQLPVGASVYLDEDTRRVWRLGAWQLCGRTRYALLDGGDGAGLRVAWDGRLKVKIA